MNPPNTCPACGTEAESEDFSYYNVTAIKNATTWVRIELTDDQLARLVGGTHRLVVVPADTTDDEAATASRLLRLLKKLVKLARVRGSLREYREIIAEAGEAIDAAEGRV